MDRFIWSRMNFYTTIEVLRRNSLDIHLVAIKSHTYLKCIAEGGSECKNAMIN